MYKIKLPYRKPAKNKLMQKFLKFTRYFVTSKSQWILYSDHICSKVEATCLHSNQTNELLRIVLPIKRVHCQCLHSSQLKKAVTQPKGQTPLMSTQDSRYKSLECRVHSAVVRSRLPVRLVPPPPCRMWGEEGARPLSQRHPVTHGSKRSEDHRSQCKIIGSQKTVPDQKITEASARSQDHRSQCQIRRSHKPVQVERMHSYRAAGCHSTGQQDAILQQFHTTERPHQRRVIQDSVKQKRFPVVTNLV